MEQKSNSILRHLLPEAVLGYIFWSLFCGIGPMIWFYPLNELDFTGYEAFLGVLLIPIICGVRFIRDAIQSWEGLTFLRLVTLACIASFHASTTFSRLVVLSVGNAAALLVFLATLWSNSSFQRCVTFWGLILGFYATLVSRIWYVTVFPTWSDPLSNQIVLTIGSLATIDRIVSGIDRTAIERKNETSTCGAPYCWIMSGVSFGSLLYLTLSVFTEVSVVSRWVVTGHPNPGPDPNPWGALVLICLGFGTLLSICIPEFVRSKLWWLVGTGGIFSLYLLPTYQGFLGGLVLATYVMSVWPEAVDRLTSCGPAKALTIAMFTFMAEILFSIWTVAYNFVPGGEYTREHTGYLLAFISLIWLLGLTFGGDKNKASRTAFASCETEHLPGRQFIWALSPGKYSRCKKVENVYCSVTQLPSDFQMTFPISKVCYVLVLLLSVGLSGFVYRLQPSNYRHNPVVKEGKVEFTALIWTYHFGYDNSGWPSLERSAQVLNDTGADFITLLESDASKPYLANIDLTSWLGEKLGLYTDFGVSTKDHTWGNLILSKYPIVKSQHHLLPSPKGELAPAISATLNISGSLVDFVTTHMGNDRDTLDRKLQAEYLADLLDKSENPVVFLGYVTSSPGSRDYVQLTKKGRVKDIDETDRDRWCEYIMYRGLIRLGYARISHGGLSDTELQLAKFQIPPTKHFEDHDQLEIDPLQVPSSQHFSEKFGPYRVGHNWQHIHRYHSSTPKYFLKKK